MPVRRSPRGMAVALAAAAILLMAAGREAAGRVRSAFALALVPFRTSAAWTDRLADALSGPDAPPDELERRVDYYRRKNQGLHVRLSETEARLAEVSGAREVVRERTTRLLPAAVVLTADGSAWRRSITATRGTSDGVVPGQLVLWEKHLVGRVAEASPWTCRIQLVTDPAFKVGAVTVPRYPQAPPSPFDEARSPREGLRGAGPNALSGRDTGVYEGCGDRAGILKWLAGETTAEESAIVVTTPDPSTGLPGGLLLGRVTGVSRSRGPFPRVDVQPFLNFRAIESVVIVLGVTP